MSPILIHDATAQHEAVGDDAPEDALSSSHVQHQGREWQTYEAELLDLVRMMSRKPNTDWDAYEAELLDLVHTMSPILVRDTTAQQEAVGDAAPEGALSSSPAQHHETMLAALDEIAIAAQARKPSCDRCGEVQVFPITAINVLSGRDQIRYMRLLRYRARMPAAGD